MVEPPGTAPGSDPLITSAFMSIVPKDREDIGGAGPRHKRLRRRGPRPGGRETGGAPGRTRNGGPRPGGAKQGAVLWRIVPLV